MMYSIIRKVCEENLPHILSRTYDVKENSPGLTSADRVALRSQHLPTPVHSTSETRTLHDKWEEHIVEHTINDQNFRDVMRRNCIARQIPHLLTVE